MIWLVIWNSLPFHCPTERQIFMSVDLGLQPLVQCWARVCSFWQSASRGRALSKWQRTAYINFSGNASSFTEQKWQPVLGRSSLGILGRRQHSQKGFPINWSRELQDCPPTLESPAFEFHCGPVRILDTHTDQFCLYYISSSRQKGRLSKGPKLSDQQPLSFTTKGITNQCADSLALSLVSNGGGPCVLWPALPVKRRALK